MGGPFAKTDMAADEFKAAFERAVTSAFDGAWTLFAETRKGFMPVGVVFGIWAPMSPYMAVAGVAWFSWASKRNIVESVVNFFSGIRREIKMMLYALPEHKKAYEVCCRHGIMQRVGTSFIVFPGRPAAIFETRG